MDEYEDYGDWKRLRAVPPTLILPIGKGSWQPSGDPRIEVDEISQSHVGLRHGSRGNPPQLWTCRALRKAAEFYIALADQLEGKVS